MRTAPRCGSPGTSPAGTRSCASPTATTGRWTRRSPFATRAARTVAREGSIGPPVDVGITTRAIEFNDGEALREALAPGDVACVIAEPAMTNMGIILPVPGYHEELRRLTRAAGTLLILDETHTFSAGPRGATGEWGLEPDMLTIGKAIAGGVAAGALGLSADIADGILGDPQADLEDTGGVGGTLAGNALSLAATRAALTEVLTDDAFAHADRDRHATARGHRERDRRARAAVARAATRARGSSTASRASRRSTEARPTRSRNRSSSAICTCTRSTAAS